MTEQNAGPDAEQKRKGQDDCCECGMSRGQWVHLEESRAAAEHLIFALAAARAGMPD
jgi:hypothetical protein